MPVTIKVNGTVNSLVHKMSNGISTATIPDVCKTPSPGGPIPTPYPNIAQSITLSDGTTTVKGDKMMAAIKGSKFALSNGDNAGVAGGVKSNVFMKEATWILYSFDVKLDGKNACRLSDKMFHNAENAANLAGEFQTPKAALATFDQWVKDCDSSATKSAGGKKKSCQQLGREKHACMDGKIDDYCKANPPTDPPSPGYPEGERGYPRPPPPPAAGYLTPPAGEGRSALIAEAISTAAQANAKAGLTGKAARKAVSSAIGKALRGKIFPDAAIHLGDGKKLFVDFKFPCPKGHPTGHKRGSRNRLSTGASSTRMSADQRTAYTTLARGTGSTKPALSLNPQGFFAY